jgi:hypothetical protein
MNYSLSLFISVTVLANIGAIANVVPESSVKTTADIGTGNGLERMSDVYYDEPHINEKHHSRTKSRMNPKASENRRLSSTDLGAVAGNGPFRALTQNSDSIGDIFVRSYLCICLPQDFAYVVPKSGRSEESFLNAFEKNIDGINAFFPGVSILQSGGCFDPADVPIVSREAGTSGSDKAQDSNGQDGNNANKPKTVLTDRDPNTGRFPFAGKRQPDRIPQSDPGFFYTSQCTGVSGGERVGDITGISCLINLCLGGGGFNCLGIYSGVGYTFNPLGQVTAFANPNENGSRPLDPDEFPFGNPRPFNNAPALPPSFPGTIFGGTGSFVGAKGTVEVTTVAAQTAIAIKTNISAGPPGTTALGPQSGFIVTKVSVVTNVPLPPAP